MLSFVFILGNAGDREREYVGVGLKRKAETLKC
jgi:hypothetical protein